MAPELDRRERKRQATVQEIKDTARRQMARDGAAHLSLGAIARAMGMTAPALYRYFDSRDALIVALIAEAYDSMGESIEGAVSAKAAGDYPGRYRALMYTYRQWARDHREEYALMYGVQVYSSEMALDEIVPAIARNLRVMVELFLAAEIAGQLRIPKAYHEPPPSVGQAMTGLRILLQDESVPVGVLVLSFTTWLLAHSLVWQELHGVMPEVLFGTGELYEMEVELLAERLGLIAGD
jgi:AcrR family transcriptional regulator